jgi:modulator of FtsH protease
VGPSPEIVEFLETWHDFFLLAGTAAVTLVGLLFVALSLNLDVLIHDTKAHLLQHARSTLLSFTYVLFISLIGLVPRQGLRMIAVNMVLLSAISLGVHLFGAWHARRQITSVEERFLNRRGRTLVVGYALGIGLGATLLITHDPSWLYLVVGLVLMLLGNAAGSSWDLLVRVGKLKASGSTSTPS